MLDILEALCISLSATYLRVVSRSSIEEFLDQLQHTNDVICSVFLLTSRMASLCLNLSSLDYVIVFDTECDPSKEVHVSYLSLNNSAMFLNGLIDINSFMGFTALWNFSGIFFHKSSRFDFCKFPNYLNCFAVFEP